jgi:cytoskeletal protein CcmA (bactofilin family)
MAIKDKGFETGEISGFLDEGTEFEGELLFRDTMRIDGKFRGKITSKSVLIIGEAADINGDIVVSHVSINGRVTGKIIADKKIEIHSKGRVYSNISTPNLTIEDGAFFHGNCNMDSKDLPKAEKEKEPAPAKEPSKLPPLVAPKPPEKKDEEPKDKQ